MKVFSLESLNKMSQHLKNNPDCTRLIDDYEAMMEELGIEFVPSPVNYDPCLLDLTPADKSDQKESDSKNALSVYKSLSFLTPAQATDERLWATLALVYFSDYTRARWPVPNTKQGNHILLHWLCKSSTRSRTRDNSISRLWWMGKIVNQLDSINQETACKVLFGNSDYRASIIERNNSSASSPNVMTAILKITLDEYNNGNQYNRDAFRSFMKKVNFLAGRSNLSVLSEKQTEDLLRPIYIECYEKVKPKKGFIERLLS